MRILRFAILFVILYASFGIRSASANEISVDKRTMQLDDSVTITVTLEDAFASLDSVNIPLRNLALDGPPSVSTEFEWINGESSRRKVFRYSAHPTAAGEGTVGPVTLHGSGGQVETLAPITIQVLPDAAAGSNDPEKILHELMASGRDPIFLVAEADRTSVFTGEEVVVTWTLYNAASVQQYAIWKIPKLDDFWTEELDTRSDHPEEIMIDGVVVQKVAIRRVALFPLNAGSLTVPSMVVSASIIKRVRTGDPFGLFEGTEVDVLRRSAPLGIRARPVPDGPPVAAVGNIDMRCGSPVQRNGGPVAVVVQLSGRANLRGAPPPEMETKPAATVQIVDRGVDVTRTGDDATMTRSWQYLFFPARGGTFTVPAISSRVLTPGAVRRDLRCSAATLTVASAAPQAPPPALQKVWRGAPSPVTLAPWVAGAAVLLLLVWLGIARARRSERVRSVVRRLIRPTVPETRDAVDAWLAARGIDPAALLHEASDPGDAYRSLRSLFDAMERERTEPKWDEIEQRVRDVVVTTA